MLALALEPAPDDLLRATREAHLATQRIDVGGIDEIHPGIRRLVQDRVGWRLLRLLAERHCAEAQTGDAEARAAKLAILHVEFPGFWRLVLEEGWTGSAASLPSIL